MVLNDLVPVLPEKRFLIKGGKYVEITQNNGVDFDGCMPRNASLGES